MSAVEHHTTVRPSMPSSWSAGNVTAGEELPAAELKASSHGKRDGQASCFCVFFHDLDAGRSLFGP